MEDVGRKGTYGLQGNFMIALSTGTNRVDLVNPMAFSLAVYTSTISFDLGPLHLIKQFGGKKEPHRRRKRGKPDGRRQYGKNIRRKRYLERIPTIPQLSSRVSKHRLVSFLVLRVYPFDLG